MKKTLLCLSLIIFSFSPSAKINKKLSDKSPLTMRLEKEFEKNLTKKDILKLKSDILNVKGKAVPALISVMKNSKFPDRNRWIATFMLGRIMGKKSAPFIAKFSEHPNWILRLASLKSLLALDQDRYAKVYEKALKDDSLLVRFQALENIKRMNLTSLSGSVWSMLYDKRNYYMNKAKTKSKRQHIVKEVIKTIGDLKFSKAQAPLLTMIQKDKYKDILIEMNYALSKITSKKSPDDSASSIKRFWKAYQVSKTTI